MNYNFFHLLIINMNFHGMINMYMYMYRMIFVCLLVCDHILCENKKEGEIVKLDFPYPCDSTEVTLQRSNGRPFYISSSPEHNALMLSRYEVRNHTDSNSDNCYLNLTINPVSRDDEGTFILMVNEDGVMLHVYTRIRLSVDHSPGKVSCESNNEYVDGEWVKLHCQASVGSLSGQIVCYQDDMRLPSLTSLEVNDDTLNQIILARLLVEGLVYCCTSTFQQAKDRCECNDFKWNPIRNTQLSNIPDPCTAATETADQDSITASILQNQENTTSNPSLDPETSKNACVSSNWCHGFIATTCLMALGYIPLIYFLYKARKKKNQLKKQSDTRNEDEPHEQHELNKTV